MSIHVISAVLNCRDPELTSSRRMVLVSLANYAGEDGHAWPSQKLVSEEAGCGIRSLKDHLKWLEDSGFIRRDTKNLGQGKGSRTSYHVDLKRLARTSADAGAKIAGADIARANSVSLGGGIPHLTNRQEPSIDTIANAIVAPPPPDPPESKSTGRVRGAARATVLPPNWTPNITNLAYASQHGLTREEINHEADQFRNHAAANGKRFKDWNAGFRTWLGNTVKWRAERTAGQAARQKPGGQSRGGGMVAAGLRAIRETRGYGEPLPDPVQGRSGNDDMGTGYDLDGDALRIAGGGQG